ncbi:MAG: DUF2155 domain-containing protein [Thermohalobaculum sp.]
MTRAALLLAALLATAARAEEIKPPDLSPADSWQKRDTATLRVLNKIDSTVETISVRTGDTIRYQTLSITLAGCYVRPADLPADATARLTIVDTRDGMSAFSGWILQKEPALNMLEHPVYDILLAGCA